MPIEPRERAREAGPLQADRDASGELWQALGFPIPSPSDGEAAAMLEQMAYAFRDHRKAFEAETRNDEREKCARETQAVWRCSIGDVVGALDCLKNYWLNSRRKAEREAGGHLDKVATIIWSCRSPAPETYRQAAESGKRMISLAKDNLPPSAP